MQIGTGVIERHAGNLHFQFLSHSEVRQALSPRRVFLRKVDLTLRAELGTPQAHAALQFFEQGDRVEFGIRLQQRDDLVLEKCIGLPRTLCTSLVFMTFWTERQPPTRSGRSQG